MKTLIKIRKEVPEIGLGDFNILDDIDDRIFAIEYKHENNKIIILNNLSDQEIEFDEKIVEGMNQIFSNDIYERNNILNSFGFRWYRNTQVQ